MSFLNPQVDNAAGHQTLCFSLFALFVAGCTSQVRVLDDQTGSPIAGVIVTPMVSNFFDDPVAGQTATTDSTGSATVRYAHRDIIGFQTQHPEFRMFSHTDKPLRDERGPVLYMRRPPRVVLVLPDSFAGPLIVTDDLHSGFDLRQSIYRISLNRDLDQPTNISPVGAELLKLDEVDAECGGVTINPAPKNPLPNTRYLWTIAGGGMFYEKDYVQMLFVGTEEQHTAFIHELHSTLGQKCDPITLTRVMLQRLRTPGSLTASKSH